MKTIIAWVAAALSIGTLANANMSRLASPTAARLVQDARNLDASVRPSYQVDQNMKMTVGYFVGDSQYLNQCLQQAYNPSQCQTQANVVFSRFGQIEYGLQYINDFRIRQALQNTRVTIDQLRKEMQGGGGNAYITASPNPCHANGHSLCTAYLRWNIGEWGGPHNNVVVSVTSRNEGVEKVFACHEGDGQAPWIAPNDQYIFKLYKNTQCDIWAVKHSYPIAQVVVRGAP